MDQVRLVGLVARGRHGVFAQERQNGQDFRVDVVLYMDTRPAGDTDDLNRTVNYGELATSVADVVRGDPLNLVETLAARIAAVCLADPRVAAADVAVHKPQAPVPERVSDVVVVVRRTREEIYGVNR
ncbi:MAG: 7,8-dihydroneopterin aldolase/epimerase/oxygenase [Actinomycetota bacterium]|nr:7,8-dihydroneopterin aldolase/epimerase/oxygenase [Actinomycetota bacterium]